MTRVLLALASMTAATYWFASFVGCEPSSPNATPQSADTSTAGDGKVTEGPRHPVGDGTSQFPPTVVQDDAPDEANPGTAASSETEQDPAPDDVSPPSEPNDKPAGARARVEDLFRDWERPDVAIVISGEQDGYIEPCGCAGKENQKGGLSRRHTLFKYLKDKQDWELVPLDLGGLVKRFGPQTDIKFHSTLDGMRIMGYDVVALGPGDLRLPEGELLAEQDTFVSANVNVLIPLPRYKVIERGGRKIGVTAVFGKSYQAQINNAAVEFLPLDESLELVVHKLQETEKCDFLVLLSHAPKDESLELAKRFPQFRVVVTAGGAPEPPPRPVPIDGSDRWLVEIGHKGMYVGVIGLFDGGEEQVRYELVPLDARFEDSHDMIQVLANYQGLLKSLGLEGLEVRTQSHPSGHKFVGSNQCAACHSAATKVFEQTPHAHALDTLVKLDPQRHFDPECLSCHVTGWEPQRFFPFTGGYLDLEKTPNLQHNGCENCHGPGSAHVAAETGETQVNDGQRESLRDALRMTLEQAEKKCQECHDLDNSPHFNFNDLSKPEEPAYWPKVEHHGKD